MGKVWKAIGEAVHLPLAYPNTLKVARSHQILWNRHP